MLRIRVAEVDGEVHPHPAFETEADRPFVIDRVVYPGTVRPILQALEHGDEQRLDRKDGTL
jgi:hypothetical protein